MCKVCVYVTVGRIDGTGVGVAGGLYMYNSFLKKWTTKASSKGHTMSSTCSGWTLRSEGV